MDVGRKNEDERGERTKGEEKRNGGRMKLCGEMAN